MSGGHPLSADRSGAGKVVRMELFTFQDLLLFATFLITLLAYIRENKRRNRVPFAELLRLARSLATSSIRASVHPAELFC